MNETAAQEKVAPTETLFRSAYILKPGRQDFSLILPHCEQLVYATDGYADTVSDQKLQLEKSLKDFRPDRDVLIPVGSASLCLLAATILTRQMLAQGKGQGYRVAVYADRSYRFWHVPTGAEELPYEFLLL